MSGGGYLSTFGLHGILAIFLFLDKFYSGKLVLVLAQLGFQCNGDFESSVINENISKMAKIDCGQHFVLHGYCNTFVFYNVTIIPI